MAKENNGPEELRSRFRVSAVRGSVGGEVGEQMHRARERMKGL